MSKASYRAGFNRGSADKIARREASKYVPVAHREDKKSYRRGYKRGYDKTGEDWSGQKYIDHPIGDARVFYARQRIDNEVAAGVRNNDYSYLVKIAKSALNQAVAATDELDEATLKKIAASAGPYIYKKVWDAGTPQDLLQTIAYMEIGARNAGEADAVRAEREAEARQGFAVSTPLPRVSTAPILSASAFKLLKGAQLSPTASADKQRAEALAEEKRRAEAAIAAEKKRVEEAFAAKKLAEEEAAKKRMLEEAARKDLAPRSLIGPATPIDAVIAPKPSAPTWLSTNWPYLVLGAALVGAGALFYRAQQNV